MKAEDVAAYLKQNPDFFMEHQEVLAELEVAAEQQPFHQRQLEVLRQRHSAEQAKYEMVVDSARNNQALEQTLHEFAQQLLGSGDKEKSTAITVTKKMFQLEWAKIFKPDEPEEQGVDVESLTKRVSHGSSICDDRVSTELLGQMFGDDHDVNSCAFIPLQITDQDRVQCIGVMVLGAADATRFQPGMGPIYLDRMGDLIAAFLSASD